MANEATLRLGLTVRTGNLDFRSSPTTCRFDVPTSKPPTPGYVSAPVGGVDVDLSAITTPGLCLLHNTGDTYDVEYGIHDSTKFQPWGVLRPGKIAFFEFSENFGQEPTIPTGTATGTDTVVDQLRVRGLLGTGEVNVLVFEADDS